MSHSRNIFFAALIFSIAFIGNLFAADNPAPKTDNFLIMANAAASYFKAGIKDITAEQLLAELNDADTTQPYLMSVRFLNDDTARGHIPGTHHWEAASLISHRDQLPKNKKIVVYCYSGQASGLVSAYLNLTGYDACNLRWGLCSWTTDTSKIGGIPVWLKLPIGHQPLDTVPHPFKTEYPFPKPKVTGTNAADLFTSGFDQQLSIPRTKWKMKTAEDVYANPKHWFVVFYGPESVYKAGHIPGAYHIEPGTLTPEQNLKFLPPDKPIIVYCLNGHASVQVSGYLNALGYDAYTMKRGLNTITDDENILGDMKWVTDYVDYPLVRGSLPSY